MHVLLTLCDRHLAAHNETGIILLLRAVAFKHPQPLTVSYADCGSRMYTQLAGLEEEASYDLM